MTETTANAIELLEEWQAWAVDASHLSMVPPPKTLRDRTYVYMRTHPLSEVDDPMIESGARAMLAFENDAGINISPREWDELTSQEADEYCGYARAVLRSAVNP